MFMRIILLFAAPFLLWGFAAQAQENSPVYVIKKGSVKFTSDAPLELIEAESKELKGLIDFGKETFAFTVASGSFEGFNSALQKEHFNENYMESKIFPRSSFSGKIIEKLDLSQDGDYTIRAKGKLVVHGVEQERIIKSGLKVRNGVVAIESVFTVPLQDHNITIPKVVYQKIAEEITVAINAVAEKK